MAVNLLHKIWVGSEAGWVKNFVPTRGTTQFLETKWQPHNKLKNCATKSVVYICFKKTRIYEKMLNLFLETSSLFVYCKQTEQQKQKGWWPRFFFKPKVEEKHKVHCEIFHQDKRGHQPHKTVQNVTPRRPHSVNTCKQQTNNECTTEADTYIYIYVYTCKTYVRFDTSHRHSSPNK